MQLAGLGAGWLPEPFVREHLAAGRLVARRTARPAPVETTRYAWRRETRGKALAWWLQRLEVARVRQRLLAGPETPTGSPSRGRARG
jgi:DNA-binding transcriptional LysR family regulator